MFLYPKQSEFNRVVPKTKIYAHARVSNRLKELFVSQVGEIVWRYKLSPETINLPARNGIWEIQVFDIHLKTPEIDDAVLITIDKAIPFPLVLQLFHDSRLFNSIVPYKRPSESDSSKWVTEKLLKFEGKRRKGEGTSGGEAAKNGLHNSSFNLHPSSFILCPLPSIWLGCMNRSPVTTFPFPLVTAKVSQNKSPGS